MQKIQEGDSQAKQSFFTKGKGKVLTVSVGGSFGELALLYSQPRAATVTATIDSKLWVVDGKTFRKIIMTSAHKKRKLYESFLKTVPILSSLEPSELVKLADALEPQDFHEGDNIITEVRTSFPLSLALTLPYNNRVRKVILSTSSLTERLLFTKLWMDSKRRCCG